MTHHIIYAKSTGLIRTSLFSADPNHYAGEYPTDDYGWLAIPDREVDGKDYLKNYYVLGEQLCEFTAQEIQWRFNTPRGFQFVMPQRELRDVRTLEEAKAQKWEEMKQERTRQEEGTFICAGVEYDADKIHISGAVQMALMSKQANAPFPINWTAADNSVVVLNADEMIAVGQALGNHVNSVYDTARQLRIDIENCTTGAQVALVSWPV